MIKFQRGVPLVLMTFTPEPRCLSDASSFSNRDLLYHPSQNHIALLSRNCSGEVVIVLSSYFPHQGKAFSGNVGKVVVFIMVTHIEGE